MKSFPKINTVFICLFLICYSCFGQKYALLDKHLKIPIIYTDSVTVEQIKKGFYPIENKNIDTLIADLLYLKNMLSIRQRAKMKSFELRAANAVITTSRIPYAYGDRYNSVAESVINSDLRASLVLINSDESNKQNLSRVNKILAYLKANKSFWKEANEIQPKVYNVIVVAD